MDLFSSKLWDKVSLGPQVLYGFLNNDHLPRVSCQSRLLASDNEMTPGVYIDLFVFAFQLRETPENLS
jgi:hypothetical protein